MNWKKSCDLLAFHQSGDKYVFEDFRVPAPVSFPKIVGVLPLLGAGGPQKWEFTPEVEHFTKNQHIFENC